jgi:hypothetical protein
LLHWRIHAARSRLSPRLQHDNGVGTMIGDFTPEQKLYLEGFASGLNARAGAGRPS